MTQPPTTLAVIPEAIAEELCQGRQCVAWRWELRDGKWTKVLINPATGNRADSTNPATWGTFEQALACAQRHNLPGIGFVFSPDDPYAGVDFDKCVDPATGEIAPDVREQIMALNSYAEYSPSGTGVKVFLKGTVPGERSKNAKLKIEMYDRKRFFTMTGHHVAGTPQMIEARQEALSALYQQLFPKRETSTDAARVNGHAGGDTHLTDPQIIAKAMAAKNGHNIGALWGGEWKQQYGSHSEADAALCSMLAFYTQDRAQVDRLFRQSGLFREKWNREDYREATLDLALSRGETWTLGAEQQAKRADGAVKTAKTANTDKDRQSKTNGSHSEVWQPLRSVLLQDVQPEAIDWLSRGRLARRKITVWDGDPGLGKSTAATDWAAKMTRGIPLPDGVPSNPASVVLLSAEDGLADTIRPRLEAAGADLSRVLAITGIQDGEFERLPALPDDLWYIEEAITRMDAALLIVDPLMAYLSGEVNSHRDQDVRRALAPLAALAERTGVAVIIVRHINKHGQANPLYRGGGSIGIIGAARFGLLVAADPDDTQKRVLASTKCNLAKPPATLAFQLDPVIGTDVARVTWLGESHHTAKSVLAQPEDDEERNALIDAQDVLRNILEDGPHPAKDVQAEARKAGISERTMWRAKAALRIEAKKSGFGSSGAWTWALPKAANEDEDCHTNSDDSLRQFWQPLTPEQPVKPPKTAVDRDAANKLIIRRYIAVGKLDEARQLVTKIEGNRERLDLEAEIEAAEVTA